MLKIEVKEKTFHCMRSGSSDTSFCFLATDVAKALGYHSASEAVRCVDKAEVLKLYCEDLGKERLFLTPWGFWTLFGRSRKPEAKDIFDSLMELQIFLFNPLIR